jgi:hypothetical protein
MTILTRFWSSEFEFEFEFSTEGFWETSLNVETHSKSSQLFLSQDSSTLLVHRHLWSSPNLLYQSIISYCWPSYSFKSSKTGQVVLTIFFFEISHWIAISLKILWGVGRWTHLLIHESQVNSTAWDPLPLRSDRHAAETQLTPWIRLSLFCHFTVLQFLNKPPTIVVSWIFEWVNGPVSSR